MRKAGRKCKAAPVTLAAVRALVAEPTATLGWDADPALERQVKVGFTAVRESGGRVRIIGSDVAGIAQGDGAVRIGPAPLDGLRARQRLDEADPDRNRLLHAAGDRLRHHHYRAGLSGFAAANDRALAGRSDLSQCGTITEAMEASRRAFYQAEAAMHPGDWAVVYAVVIEEQTLEAVGLALTLGARGAAVPVALDRLRRGLQALAERWGFLVPERLDEAMSADPGNVNAARSDGATVKVGAAPKLAGGRGCARARMPNRGHAKSPASGAQFRRGQRQH